MNNKKCVVIVAVLLVVANLLVVTPVYSDYTITYTAHSPVYINGNENFTSENGVVSGSGTEEDPYIIEGWEIDANGGNYSIRIENTTAHFIIRNCILHNATYSTVYETYSAVYLKNVQNGVIIGNNISGNNCSGVTLWNSSNNNITGNNVYDNSLCGINFYSSSNNNITGNNVYDNSLHGIYLYSSRNNTITSNNVSDNSGVGIYLYSSSNNTLTNNTMYNNGLVIWGYNIEHWNTHDIDTSNLVNGKPLYYYKNQDGINVSSDAGQVILANCTNFTISNLTLNNCSIGIQLGFSSSNNITGNIVSDNSGVGIYLFSSSNNNITGNNASGNFYYGIYLDYSSDNNIANNIANSNYYGIYLTSFSNNNLIYNNYFNNTNNWYVSYGCSGNFWNMTKTEGTNIIGGPYLGGNYWSDYNGTDTDGDGLGDTELPYGPGDWHPLVPLSNYPPIANFTYEPVHPSTDDTIYFNSTSYDIDGSIVNWTWNLGDGTVKYGEKITHQYTIAGVYNVNLTVIDNEGGTGYCEKQITVLQTQQNNAPNKPTLVAPANNSMNISINPTLTVHVIDTDGDQMTVKFYGRRSGNGTWQLLATNTNVTNDTNTSITWNNLEYNTTYEWYAVANDSQLENTSDIWKFKTQETGNQPPTVEITKPKARYLYIRDKKLPFKLKADLIVIIGPINVTVNASDPDGNITKVEFYIDDELKNNSTVAPYYYYWNEKTIGIRTIKVKVYDDKGAASEAEIDAIVFNLGRKT